MQVVNVSDVIERQRASGFIVRFVFLSALIMFFDGYDVAAMAYAAPLIIRDWQLERAAIAVVFTSAFTGMAIGSVLFGICKMMHAIAVPYSRQTSPSQAPSVFCLFKSTSRIAGYHVRQFSPPACHMAWPA